MNLYITRHGVTGHNIEGVIQGGYEGSVSELGLRQVDCLIKRIEDKKFEKIFSSDALRCRETTEIIAEKLKIPIEYTKLLREKNNGDFVGKKNNEVDWKLLGDDFDNACPPNGESLVMVRERGRKFWEEKILPIKNIDSNFLIVSHGGFLKVFLGDLLGMSLKDSIFKLFIEHCSLSILKLSPKNKSDYCLKTLGDYSHLGDELFDYRA